MATIKSAVAEMAGIVAKVKDAQDAGLCIYKDCPFCPKFPGVDFCVIHLENAQQLAEDMLKRIRQEQGTMFNNKPVKRFAVQGPSGTIVEIERGCRFASNILCGIAFKGTGTILGVTVNADHSGAGKSLAHVALRVDESDELRAIAKAIHEGGFIKRDPEEDAPGFTGEQGIVMIGDGIERAIRDGEITILPDEPRDTDILTAARAYRAAFVAAGDGEHLTEPRRALMTLLRFGN